MIFEQTLPCIGHDIGRCVRDLKDQMVWKGGVGRVPPFLINFKNIYPSINIKRVVVLENRRTEEYNERSLKHLSLSLNSFFMGFFLKFGIWYSQELRVQWVKNVFQHQLYGCDISTSWLKITLNMFSKNTNFVWLEMFKHRL
jgi:hypothetical protein